MYGCANDVFYFYPRTGYPTNDAILHIVAVVKCKIWFDKRFR